MHGFHSLSSAFVLILTVLGLSACQSNLPPPSVPVSEGTSHGGMACPSNFTAQAGDTVYSVARRCGVSVRELIETNHLQPPYALAPGSLVQMPGGTSEIIVAKGDTLIRLAHAHHVDYRSLAAANGKSPPYTLRIGERLRLPGSYAPPPNAVTMNNNVVIRSPIAPPGKAASTPADHGVPELAQAPPLAHQPASPQPTPAPPADAPPPPPPPPPQQVAAVPPPPIPTASLPAMTAKGFMWPVQGNVLVGFGPKAAKGQNNDGINIAATKGAPFVAVEGGVVAYVGNELKGFGNLVLIKHADGWMSAYAHADRVLVHKGQSVTKGQEIGTVGQTGSVNEPQLHFELRREGDPVDPQDYLPS